MVKNITDERVTLRNPKVFLSDPDVTLWHGDVRETLAQLEPGSVDCVVTSPPYWGLRDYGTGVWEGGDPECDHRQFSYPRERETPGGRGGSMPMSEKPQRDVCGKCGATRVDQQLGLEATPELYVENMVAVFREVWRVLADHGTCWVNMGDSYATTAPGSVVDPGAMTGKHVNEGAYRRAKTPLGLKPKDLVGVPWRLAFALQADGWWLRSAITWCKPNCMPESVTDRPTKATEMVFLLAKKARYYYDAEAVREPHSPDGRRATTLSVGPNSHPNHAGRDGHERWPNGGRNLRDWWEIATQPYPEAHFATFPEELARRCILAGCPEWVCGVCGKPRERIVRGERVDIDGSIVTGAFATDAGKSASAGPRPHRVTETLGWSDCGHGQYRPGRVLDPFVGSGTVPHVARKHGRHAIGIDLNGDYLKLAGKRLQQLSLLA